MVKGGSSARLARGRVLYPKTTLTESGASSAKLELGALSATQTLYVFLHVFSATGTPDWAIDVRSDADAIAGGENIRGSFADIVVTGPATQVIEIEGAVTDEFWEVNITKTTGDAIVLGVSAAIVTT